MNLFKLLIVAGAVLLPSIGLSYEVCGNISYFDSRSNRSDNPGSRIAHEVGHLVMKRHLNHSGHVSWCNGNQLWSGSSGKRCATSEGWADFFATAIYWTPAAVDPWVLVSTNPMEGKTYKGNYGYQDCVSQHNSPNKAIGNVARAFWDMYDTTSVDEGLVDVSSVSLSDLIETWDEFPSSVSEGCSSPDCLGNRENNEGWADPLVEWDGRNLWDYDYHFRYNYDPGNTAAYWATFNNCAN